MDNNWNVSAAVIDAFIEDAYEEYITTLFEISTIAIGFYAALSKLPEEVEHIWFKPFSLPTLLYIFARYAPLTGAGLGFLTGYTLSEGLCNIYANVANFMALLSNIGVQGLLIARAYSLCNGTKILTMGFASCFLAQLIAILYIEIKFPGCLASPSAELKLIALIQNIVGVITEVIVFGICMWKVWGTWKLKRQAGIQSERSLVSIVIKQSISRCCFVIAFNTTHATLLAITAHSPMLFTEQDFGFFADALSSILVAEFTLDLRRLNSAKITASNVSLPTLQLSNVLQRAHQSILVEMATPEEEGEGGDHDHDHDDNPESVNDMDTQPVQESNV